ncbi:MAG: cupin domain-containing protein [Pseudomonadota bacterium]
MQATIDRPSFTPYPLAHGLLADLRDDGYPTQLWGLSEQPLTLPAGATHFGYVYDGSLTVEHAAGEFKLRAGMYFCAPGETTVRGNGRGIAASRLGYDGFFQVGGPVEERGRLKYIDGCTDSLLIPPVTMGDACFNLLYFPPGVDQTQHTHPSMRVGMVIRGRGECITPKGNIPLIPGRVFIIHAEGPHGFRTTDSEMAVVAYHPDSDFGPTHETHPMINRTIVDGVSAREIAEIRTK